jgi:hypothetical protein
MSVDYQPHPYHLGKTYCFRTVTQVIIGRLAVVLPGEVVVYDAAWVADTGRWSVALATGQLRDVEPYPDGPVVISRAALVDVCEWNHALPRPR